MVLRRGKGPLPKENTVFSPPDSLPASPKKAFADGKMTRRESLPFHFFPNRGTDAKETAFQAARTDADPYESLGRRRGGVWGGEGDRMAAPQGPVTVDESSSLTGIDSRAGSLSPERFLLPSPVFPPHLPLPAHSEILGLAQTELGTDEALLIGERGRGGSRQHGTAARALE